MSENSTTYNRILSKGIESNLPAIEDGKLRFTTDTGRLFLDDGSSRIEITDFVKGRTAEQIIGILAPLPKLYLASDTHEVYFYDNGWQTVAASDCVNASTAQYAVTAAAATTSNGDVTSITRSGLTFTVTKRDGSTFTFDQVDNNTTYNVATTASSGLLPQLGGGTSNYLRADGEWATPPNDNTTYTTATTSSSGLLPKLGGGTTYFLRADGTWAAPPNDNTTYANMTSASAGLAPAGGSGTTKYLRQDGSWQVPPNDNTTYDVASSASAGLMPAINNNRANFLRGDGTWDTPPNDNTTYTNGTGLSLSNGTFSINENASTVAYAKNAATATADGSGNTITNYYAPKASPAFTGTPTAPDVADGDTSGKIANTKFVATAIAAAISGVSGLSYEVVTELPTTGESGVIYLVSNGSSTAQNIYDEYIWLGASYEKIGTTAMDLSNYVNTVSETGTGNAYTSFTKNGNTLTLTKGSTFLTGVPAQYATTATYTAGDGISKSGTQFSNSGVRAVATGTTDGTVNVNTNGTTANVAVKGLGAMAYKASVSKSDVGLDNVANYDQSKAVVNISRSGNNFTATAIDGSTFGFTQKDNDTTYAVATTASSGLLPQLGGGTSNYLRADGTWQTPPNDNTTYAVATTSAAGLLPELVGGTTYFLRADGTWAAPPNDNTTYANMTSASAGLAPAGGSGTTKYLRQDGSWQVPPDNNTTYTNGTGLSLSNGTFSINQSASTVAYADKARLSTNAATAAWADSSYYANQAIDIANEADIDFGDINS